MWDCRLTSRLNKVLTSAEFKARRLNQSYVDTGHMLLALIELKDEDIIINVLKDLGVNLRALKQKIRKKIKPNHGKTTCISPEFTPTAKFMIDLAKQEAREMGYVYTGPIHLLLAFLTKRDETANSLLLRGGLNRGKVLSKVLSKIKKEEALVMQSYKNATKAGRLCV